jgi:hypothetical protein
VILEKSRAMKRKFGPFLKISITPSEISAIGNIHHWNLRIPPNSHKMGRRRIYVTEQEKKQANRAKSKKYYEKFALR